MTKTPKASSPLKRLLTLLLHHPFLLTFFFFVSIAQVFLNVYLPILLGVAVDALLVEGVGSLLKNTLFLMAVVIVVTTILQWISPILINQLVYGLVAELRQEVFKRLHHIPLSYLEKQSTGDLVARVSSDSEQLTNGLLMIFNQFLLGILTILCTIVTMADLDFLMMVIVVALTPLSLFFARFIALKSYLHYRKQTVERGRLVGYFSESIGQLSLIQSFNAQEEFLQQAISINQDYAEATQAAIFSSSTVNPVTRFINALIYALLTGVGAFRMMRGNLSVGELTTFLQYASQYGKPFNDISSVLSELQSALACAERLFSILDQNVLETENKQELQTSRVIGEIAFQHVFFSYQPNKPLLEDLHLTIPAGSKVAIVGPTGAGKSTLINLLMGFYPLDRGDILLDNHSITSYSQESLRQQIGMVLQETWLKSATIHDNIAFGYPQATRELVIEAAKAANADFFIRQLPNGYDTFLADAGESLSQGQRQLLAIARVFVKLPKILILDEATSSIDTRTELLIQEAFEKLMRGRTSFVIAHRLSTIQSADIILVMVDGKIAEIGNHRELMKAQGIYYKMQQAQFIE